MPSPPPAPSPTSPSGKPPNFVILITDDQDDILNSTHPHYMPELDVNMRQKGTQLSNFLVSTGLCCPARTSLMTGKLVHCHNVTANHNTDSKDRTIGGFQKFYEEGLDQAWLPTLLQAAGYDTSWVGKFLNGYKEDLDFMSAEEKQNGYMPRGVKHFDIISARLFALYNNCWSLNGKAGQCFKGQYQTDIIRNKTLDLISSQLTPDKPFFLYIAPTAPHMDRSSDGPFPAAVRHRHLYDGENIQAPRGPNFGLPRPDMPKGAVRDDENYAAEMDADFLGRVRMLKSVDEMLGDIVEALRAKGLLDETYIIYTSDNGYHLGAFRLRPGKNCPIEEDVRVPLFIRGPGVPQSAVLPYQGNMIDIAPTLLTLAGLPVPDSMSGLPLPLTPTLVQTYDGLLRAASPQPQPYPSGSAEWLRRDTNILEAWNGEEDEDEFDLTLHFKGLRLCTDTRLLPPLTSEDLGSQPDWAARFVQAPGMYCYKYMVWCGPGALRELYDLASDPYETLNRLSEVPQRLLDRLDGVLSALVHCSGAACRSPYALLHPEGGVLNFSMTLDPAYDALYRSLPKLRLLECMGIYRIGNEPTWTLYQSAASAEFSPWPPMAFLPDAPGRPPPAPRAPRAVSPRPPPRRERSRGQKKPPSPAP